MAIEIVEARLDLIHRYIDGARDVAGGKFGGGTHVHEQSAGGCAILQLRDADRRVHMCPYYERAEDLAKGFRRGVGIF
jgi:hypothetical protein